MDKRVWMGMLVVGGYWLFAPMAMGIEPPDTDGNGVSDVSDQCVADPGHVDSPFGSGCPCSAGGVTDADCDGIPDTEDESQDYGSNGGTNNGGTSSGGPSSGGSTLRHRHGIGKRYGTIGTFTPYDWRAKGASTRATGRTFRSSAPDGQTLFTRHRMEWIQD